MSSDYRPRGAGGGSSSGGGRRRRGGRGRGSRGASHTENRVHSNGSPGAAQKKEKSLFGKLFGWLSGKKAKPEPKQPLRTGGSGSRPDFKEREPRAERPERPRREDRPPKPDPTPQEIVSPKLYVGNLAYEAAESDLFDLFSKIGAVKNVEIAMDRHANRSKGFGFVEMEALETAKEAAAKLNRTDFMGRQIVVSGAKVDKRPSAESSPREPDPTSQEHEAGSSSDEASA
ncbi:MAG: RNA-binding protein [Methylacidiphilales bacterium]|nr:RNA-binding protein [Candidatus Methylacidiphilales bacterium]